MQDIITGKDFYLSGPYARYMDMVAPVGQLLIRHGRWPAGAYPVPALDDFNLQLATDAQGHRFDLDFGAGRSSHLFCHGDFHFSPPGVSCDYKCHGQVTVMAIHISPLMLEDLAIDNCSIKDFGKLHSGKFRDSLVQSAMLRLLQEGLAPNAASQCLADTLKLTILAALVSRVCSQTTQTISPKALSPYQLRKATEYAESALETPLRLKAWASHIGLSSFHFARAFKISTGTSPHQYLLQARVRHAEQMMQETQKSLIEIAFSSGFSSQAHMTRLFTKLRGRSPGLARKLL